MSHMRMLMMVSLLAVLVAATPMVAGQSKADVTLRAAAEKETVQGDLKGAIGLYERAIKEAGSNRALAVRALLAMADAYRKLGDAEAQNIYERVVREYGDQREAVALARTRLGAHPLSATDVQTRWRGPDVDTQGTISLDGRYLSYADRKTGDLAIRNLVAGTSRRLTAAPGDFSDFAQYSAISRDGKQVAYAWYVEKTGRYGLRILSTEATPQTVPRVTADNPELEDIYPYDWSPDGRWIAVRLSRPERTAQIGVVATRDLSITVLKSVDWAGPTKMFFSPDGRYLAYDMPVGDGSKQRDVFVLSIDGSRDVPAVAHPSNDVIMGWTPDGRSLLFASNRSGAMGLWKVPMADGKPTGPAALLRPDIGPVTDSLGVTKDGTLVLGLRTGGTNIYSATIDPTTGKFLAPPAPLVDGYLQSNRQAAWSPDGKAIAYLSARPNAPLSLVIQSLDSGRTTELHPPLSWFNTPTWAPDGSIAVSGADLKGHRAIHRIDLTTGQATEIVTSPSGQCDELPSWSSDGRVLVYLMQCDGLQATDPGSAVIVRDTATGAERNIVKAPVFGIGPPAVSPNGRQVAYVRTDAVAKSHALMMVPSEGGMPRQILQVATPVTLSVSRPGWTADGRRLALFKRDGSRNSVLLVPLEGGATVEVELGPADIQPALHPDGRRLAFTRGETEREVRVVDLQRPAPARR